MLQVDSITETRALHQEAYMLFYVRQGLFPWFSSLLEHTVLMPVTEHQTKVKKTKTASATKSFKSVSLGQNAPQLMKGETSARRNCLLKSLDSHNVMIC